MGNDPCFLKLAYWPEDTDKQPVEGLVPGMYLPVSYVRLLLKDDCTRGVQAGSQARLLGYEQVERYLINTQFIELVKHGLAGTVGTTAEELHSLVQDRIERGQSVVLAAERSRESVRARQNALAAADPRPSATFIGCTTRTLYFDRIWWNNYRQASQWSAASCR